MKPVTIYALLDPRDGAIRYVGKTKMKLSQRLAVHLHYARKERLRTYSQRWMRQLLDAGLRPTAAILEISDDERWVERERHWIAKLKADGWRLTNSTGGGDGGVGHLHSEESRQKMSKASMAYWDKVGRKPKPERKGQQPLTDTQRAHASAIRKGKPKPPRSAEHCQKISDGLRGKKHSEESNAARSVALRGVSKSAEHRQRLSEAAKRRYAQRDAN